MTWPTPQDYNEAIQNPSSCFMDARLKACSPDATALGLPRAITGAFATVYRLSSMEKHWAVRCFLQHTPDLPKRYSEMSNFVCGDDLPYTVDVHYQQQGIKVKGEWYPILLMEWVDGPTLDQYIFENLENPSRLKSLADKFTTMMGDMQQAGIAHGDLQHGNIIIVDDEIRLVDYDCMFVPALEGMPSNELGHMNYQHPARTDHHFGPYLDNFSAWTILTSIQCLAADNRLWEWLSAGDECLLFRKADFTNPLGSRSFATLESHTNETIQRSAKLLRAILNYPLVHVPSVTQEIQQVEDLPEVQGAPLTAPIMRSSKDLPAWMQESAAFYVNTQKAIPRGAWPRFEQYKKAVANGATTFDDPELQVGKLLLDEARFGGNGIVFKMVGFQRELAVKCFLNDVPDRAERYAALARAIPAFGLEKYFLKFDYLPAGIKVGKYYYPVLKMNWSYGPDLERTIKMTTDTGGTALSTLASNFAIMMQRLEEAGIAHGDIEPTNLLIEKFDFKLIDYDSIYVPELAGRLSAENGNHKFQHPQRTRKHFGPYIDNYSAAIVDFYIRIASKNPALWELINRRLKNNLSGDNEEEWTFRYMALNPDRFVKENVKFLRTLLDMNIESIPGLAEQAKLHVPEKSLLQKGLDKLLHLAGPMNESDKAATEYTDGTR